MNEWYDDPRNQSLCAAAAVMCLLEGRDVDLKRVLRGLGSPSRLAALQDFLRHGNKRQRAEALATLIHPIAADLESLGLR